MQNSSNKYMKTLLTLGCSLAPPDNYWPLHVGKLFDKHDAYAFGGGGNQMLLDCIDEYLLTHSADNLTILYQMTGMTRAGGLYNLKEYPQDLTQHVKGIHEPEGGWDDWNGVFGKQHIIWTDRHHVVKNEIRNPTTMITRVVSKLCLLARAGIQVYTFRGWSGILENETYSTNKSDYKWEQIKNILNQNNVNCIDEPYVDWCVKNDKKFFEDDWHPRSSGSRDYADEFIIPLIKTINTNT